MLELKLDKGKILNISRSFTVESGVFLLEYYDHEKGEKKAMQLLKGECVHIPVGCAHKIICVKAGKILEASTIDLPHDSYRIDKSSV